jgi:hypothetical protein
MTFEDSRAVRASVPPRRSLWIMVVTPLCVGVTALRLLGAMSQLHHETLFLLLGLLFGGLYVWIVLQNLFEREEVQFDPGMLTATSRLLWWRRVRRYPVQEIRAIHYLGYVARGEPCVRLTLNGRRLPISMLRGLQDDEAETLFRSLNRSLPIWASKLSV